MEKSWKCEGAAQTLAVAAEILEFCGDTKILCLHGDLGAGKTLLVKGFADHLKVEGYVSSPTYSLVNEYLSKIGLLYHFDLYRLENAEQALDIGFYEYLDSGNYCFIEWPEIIVDYLPEKKADIYISVPNPKARIIRVIINERQKTF